MSTHAMGFGSNVPLIRRAYRESGRFQWLREVVVNSIQNDATRIHFTKEWQAAKARGVHRRMIVDNGTGIPGNRMLAFLNKFGGSGKTIGEVTENFGVGFKTSCLPWNTYGVVAISRYEGKQYMVWLHHDAEYDSGETPNLGAFGARFFDDPIDGDVTEVVRLDDWESFELADEPGVDWTKVFPGDEDGFCLVLLGNSPMEHTVLGDRSRSEKGDGKYDIVRYLNSRFWTFPEGLKISVDQEESWSRMDEWVTDPAEKVQTREPHGLKANLEMLLTPTKKHPGRGAAGSGVMTLPGTDFNPEMDLMWWLSTAEGVQDKAGDLVNVNDYQVAIPAFAFQHEAHPGVPEVFSLEARRGDDTRLAQKRARQFTGNNPVMNRLAVIVQPKVSAGDAKIYPNGTRSQLLFESAVEGGSPLSWDPVVEFWTNNRPEAVQEAIQEHYDSLKSSDGPSFSEAERKNLASRYGAFLKIVAMQLVPTKNKTGRMGPGAPISGKSVVSKTKQKNGSTSPSGQVPSGSPDDQTNLAERMRRGGLVKVLPSGDANPEWAVTYDHDARCGTLHTEHPSVRQLKEWVAEAQIETKNIPVDLQESSVAIVFEVVEKQMLKHLTLAISEAVAASAARPEKREEILSDAALSNCLRGMSHIEQMCAGMLSQKLPNMKKSA